MSRKPLRGVVPMFGGATSYVDTLDRILRFVHTHQPSVDELVGWHRGTFEQVSSRESIARRVDYLEDVGFIVLEGTAWKLGQEGKAYVTDQTTDTLLEIMCRRNVGLRSLLYALSVGPMTIREISQQQLDTHPDLGWDPANTDMAIQRVNWLRSLGLVRKEDNSYVLTEDGHGFISDSVEQWAGSSYNVACADSSAIATGVYETTVQARSMDPEFRATVLSEYNTTCPVSGIDHPALLDVAHVLSWSEYPNIRADLRNVIPLGKTHHAAFDRGLYHR